MRLWNRSIIFTWHRKEPTHNKRRTRWWQILLTLLQLKGEISAGGPQGCEVYVCLGFSQKVQRWPLAQPDGEHTHVDMPAKRYVNAILVFDLTILCNGIFDLPPKNSTCHERWHESDCSHGLWTESLWPAYAPSVWYFSSYVNSNLS